ncbi:HAD-IA family hydrolase, partial [Candidatus Pacearchaeota archaeon]|nr:HAD-IA family hydrolase [Candidatus Pacearchaeota archaeon]
AKEWSLRASGNSIPRVLMMIAGPTKNSGSGVVVEALAREHQKAGGSIAISVSNRKPVLPADVGLDDTAIIDTIIFNDKENADSRLMIPVYSAGMPFNSLRYKDMELIELIEFLEVYYWKVKSLVNEYQPDIIHTNHLFLLNPLVQLIAPWIPVVVTTHGTVQKMLDEDKRMISLVGPAIRRVDRIFSISSDISADTQRIFETREQDISLIGNGFDKEIFSPRAVDKAAILGKYGIVGNFDKIVLYIGRFVTWKGLEYVVESGREYSSFSDEKTLTLFVGSGSKEILEQYQARIDELGLGGNIKIIAQWISAEEVADLNNLADIFVLPSVMEPFSLVLLQALACGCRVIAANCGGPKMLVQQGLIDSKNAILIEPIKVLENGLVDEGDTANYVSNLAQGIKALLRADISQADRVMICNSVQGYSWPTIYNKISSVYADVIRRRIERYHPELRPSVLKKLSQQVKFVEFHPTNKCNLNCYACPYGHLHKEKAMFPFEHAHKIVAMNPEFLFIVGGGEPTMYMDQGHDLEDLVRELRYKLPNTNITLCSNGIILMGEALQKDVDSLHISTHDLKASHFSGEEMPKNVKLIWNHIWQYFQGPVEEIWVTFLFDRENAVDALVIAQELWKNWKSLCEQNKQLSNKKFYFKLLYAADDSVPENPFHLSNPDDDLHNEWTESVDALKVGDQPFGMYLSSYSHDVTKGGFFLPKEITSGQLPKRKSISCKSCKIAQKQVLVAADGNVYPCRLQAIEKGYRYAHVSDLSVDRLTRDRERMFGQALPSCLSGCRLHYTSVGRVTNKVASSAIESSLGKATQNIHLLVFDIGATFYVSRKYRQLQERVSLKIISEKAGVSTDVVLARFKEGLLFEEVVRSFGQSIKEHFQEKTRRIERAVLEPNEKLRAILQKLAERYHLAVVTNNGQEMMLSNLKALGVEDLIEYGVAIDMVDKGKPDPLMFRMVCNYFALKPDQAVSIGDLQDLDIDAAASIGMNTVLVQGPEDIVHNLEGKLKEIEQRISNMQVSQENEQKKLDSKQSSESLDVMEQDSSVLQGKTGPLSGVKELIHNAGVYGNMSTGKWISFSGRASLVAQGRFSEVMPVNAQFVPTSLCPYNCTTCTYGRSKDEIRSQRREGCFNKDDHLMSLEDMKLYLDKLAEAGVQGITITGGGDPLFNPHTLDGIEYASRTKGLATGLFTEGYLITDEMAERMVNVGLRFIRISFNAGRPITYKHFFGTKEESFYRVLNNIEKVVAAKERFGKKLGLGIGVIITPLNMTELMEIARLIQGINDRHPGMIAHIWYRPTVRYTRGVQLTNPKTEECPDYIKRHPDLHIYYEMYRDFVYGGKQFPGWIFDQTMNDLRTRIKPIIESEATSLKIFYPETRMEAMGLREKGFSKCRACPWLTFIGPDGSVYHCVEHGLDPEAVYGNLKTHSLAEIWNSPRRREVMDMMDKEGLSSKCPPMCMLTEHNRMFHVIAEALKNPENHKEILESIESESKRFMKEYGAKMGDARKFMGVI